MDIQGGTQNVKIAGNVFFPNTSAFPPGSFVVGRRIGLDFETTTPLNAYPTENSPLRTAANVLYAADVRVDFDGTPRGNQLPADAGAYEWISFSGRKWNVSAGFKPLRDDGIAPVPEITPTSTPHNNPISYSTTKYTSTDKVTNGKVTLWIIQSPYLLPYHFLWYFW